MNGGTTVYGTAVLSALFACAVSAAGYVALDDAGWKVRENVTFDTGKPYGAGCVREGDEIVLANASAAEKRGMGWVVKIEQTTPAPVRFSAEGRAVKAPGGNGFELFADVGYADGSHEWGRIVQFRPDPEAGWHRRTLVFDSGKALDHVAVYVMLRGTAGEVRFRAPVLETMPSGTGTTRLDGVAVKKAPPPAKESFFLRDAAEGTGFEPVGGAALGVKVETACEERDGARHMKARLSGEATRDRALTLLFAVPLAEGEITWHEDPRTSRIVTAADGEQRVTTAVPYGAGALSKWPLAACSVDGSGVAIAVDPEAPAVYRVALNPALRILYIAFDVGLAPEKNDARLGFALFPFAAADRFRGALEAWAKVFPFPTANRMKKFGLWTVKVPPYKIEKHEDFGFMYMEGDEGQWQWYDQHGIYCFHYTEPSSWWMRLKGKDGGLPTYDECVVHAEALAARGEKRALAWKTSAAMDEFGRKVGHIQSRPWTPAGTMWSLNSAPGIEGEVTDYKVKVSEESFKERYGGKTFPEGPDGEYIDSSEMGFSIGADYDRAHFSAMETPLCWGGEKKRPCISGAMVSYEYARSIHRRLNAYGRFTLANSTPYRTSLIVPWLDVPGTETDWNRGDKWNPTAHKDLIYKRAIAGKKPYCFLQNSNYTNFSHSHVERYMQRALAYGMFPGFFSDNGFTDCYFSFPEYYNRDRDLFKKYVPLVCELAAAGWKPVTALASSSDPEVLVEQFGDRYVTVFNSSTKETKTVKIASTRTTARERVAGGEWKAESGFFTASIPPETVRMLDFAPKTLKVLAIGNSYSVSVTRQLPQVAADLGLPLDLMSANVGGCSLERQIKLMDDPSQVTNHAPWYTNWSYADGGAPDLPSGNWNHLKDAIAADDWDVITIQQVSHESWRPESFHPWGDELVKRIRAIRPGAEIVVQEVWSDHPGSGRLSKWKLSSEEMYSRMRANYAKFAAAYGFRVIPTGAAVEAAREVGMVQKTASDPHLNKTGEFLQALVWAKTLFGADVIKGKYVPEGTDPAIAGRLREIADTVVTATKKEKAK
ncbi:MAG: DUF4886 domain-containing protein [Kiritimatiellae bacterium]|nr:DUF4886 domain-containing protein [Kiritimatiellia bacterium]